MGSWFEEKIIGPVFDPLDLSGRRGAAAAETATEAQVSAQAEAGKLMRDITEQSLKALRDLFTQGIEYEREQTAPYRKLSLFALEEAKRGLETGTPSMLAKLEMGESEKGINRAARARGIYGSGAALEAISRSNERILAQDTTRSLSMLAGIPMQPFSGAGTFGSVGSQMGQFAMTGAQSQSQNIMNTGALNAMFYTGQYQNTQQRNMGILGTVLGAVL